MNRVEELKKLSMAEFSIQLRMFELEKNATLEEWREFTNWYSLQNEPNIIMHDMMEALKVTGKHSAEL